MKNIIKSTFISSAIAIGLKVFLNLYPVQTYKGILKIPISTQINMQNINCVSLSQERSIDSTIFKFESKSISKDFARNCINKGVEFVRNELNKKELYLKKNYKTMLEEYNRLISKIENSNKLDQQTLFLIHEHNNTLSNLKEHRFYNSGKLETSVNNLKEYRFNNSDNLEISVNNIELKLQTSIYKNKWRYTLIAFLLSYWLAFVSFEYLKNEK